MLPTVAKKKPKKKNTEVVYIVVPSQLKEELDRIRETEHITIQGQGLMALEDWVAKKKKERQK